MNVSVFTIYGEIHPNAHLHLLVASGGQKRRLSGGMGSGMRRPGRQDPICDSGNLYILVRAICLRCHGSDQSKQYGNIMHMAYCIYITYDDKVDKTEKLYCETYCDMKCFSS